MSLDEHLFSSLNFRPDASLYESLLTICAARKGTKFLLYTPYGLKLGVEFNRIGYKSGEDFVLFLIQDLELNIVLLLLFF